MDAAVAELLRHHPDALGDIRARRGYYAALLNIAHALVGENRLPQIQQLIGAWEAQELEQVSAVALSAEEQKFVRNVLLPRMD